MSLLASVLYGTAYVLNYLAGMVHASTERVTGRCPDFGFIRGMRRADKFWAGIDFPVKLR